MGLHKLDFLSDSPQVFIFQQNSNKTNLGGILSLIYLIVFLILALYYISIYILEDNYSVQYLFYEQMRTRNEEEKMLNDERYNPLFDINIKLFDGPWDDSRTPDDRFVVMDYISKSVFQYGIQRKTFSEVYYLILYDCLNNTKENCIIDKNLLYNNYLTFVLHYNGYILDHQNKASPLYRYENGLGNIYRFPLDESKEYRNTWSIIKYKEEKGFFSFFDLINNQDEDYGKYIGIRQSSSKIIDIKDPFYNSTFIKQSYIILGIVGFELDFHHYEEYQRTPKSLLTTLSNICSLGMTVFNGFCLIFRSIYSNNFDNYKILEKILFNNQTKNKKDVNNKKIIELSNDFNKTDTLIDKPIEENNLIIQNNELDKEDKRVNNNIYINNKDIKLPKLHFYDFLFNNIYFIKLFKRNNKQEIISKCNEIIYKYYSIENVLYNQIRLENMIKDYKWNDSGLSDFTNNELIIQLKNFISSYSDTIGT